MSKFISAYDGNLTLQAQDNGTITVGFFPGPAGQIRGTVHIKGDLTVDGTTTTVNTAQLDIEDNIITLNKGETGAGISEDRSGIVVERGTLDNAGIIFNELISYYDPSSASTKNGLWEFAYTNASDVSNIGPIPIFTTQIASNGQDLFVAADGGILKTETNPGIDQYHENILYYNSGVVEAIPTSNPPTPIKAGNAVPNMIAIRDYVNYVVTSGLAFNVIGQEDSKIEVLDDGAGPDPSAINFELDGTRVFSVTNLGTEVQTLVNDLEITGSKIRTTNSLDKLQLQGWSGVEIDNILEIKGTDTAPESPDHGIKIYTQQESTGKTGLYFINESQTQDELVSKNRALLFSMIF